MLKSMRDQHFSILSMYLKRAESKKRLTNVNEICETFVNYQNESNQNRIKKGMLPINYFATVMPLFTEVNSGFIKINQLESLYNIQNIKINDNFVPHTTIFSDLNLLLSIEATDQTNEDEDNNTSQKKVNKINRLKDADLNLDYLKRKHANLKDSIGRAIRHNNSTEPDLTQNSWMPNDDDIPEFCMKEIISNPKSKKKSKTKVKMHETPCTKHCYYELNQIEILDDLSLQQELSNHNHPKRLKKNKTKTYLVAERRKELIEHYTAYHQKH